MDSLRLSLGARGVCFHPQGIGSDRGSLPASQAYQDLLAEMFSDGWHKLDVRAQRGWPLVEQGKPIVLEDDMTTPEERRSLPIYADFFARHDLTQFAGLTFRIDDQHWVVNAIRSERDGGFRSDEVAQMIAMRPHITRLFRFATRMSNIAGRGALSAFAMSSAPAVLLDWRGKVVEINDAALPFIGELLDLRNGKLSARDPQAGTRLKALIERARGIDGKGSTMELPRDGVRPLVVEIIPVRNRLADVFNMPSILVMLTQPESRQSASREVLRVVFQLTRRETDVAERLGKGQNTSEIAEALELRTSTVRQITKSVLLKTDTRRQADLTALIARFPARDTQLG